VRALGPEGLKAWLKSSDLPILLPAFGSFVGRCTGDRATFDMLRLTMALRTYALERGTPPRRFGDLVGPHLKTLPEGFETPDPLTSREVRSRAR
jgi:hypothetical protein